MCLLHANELPLRHLINELGGRTSGPEGFTGIIGKSLENCEKCPVLDFEQIHADEIDINPDGLSTDQKYLAEIYTAISTGICTDSLAKKNPGNMSHSRWLTTANRVLRLYVSTELPSDNLKIIVTYIMKVYIPTWFDIKREAAIIYGVEHLFSMIQRSRFLNSRCRNIVDVVLQRNAFFGHPENILIRMIHDESGAIRELGWRRILKARNMRESSSTMRNFRTPKLNFDARNYHDIIDWKSCELSEPPLTMQLT